MDAVVAALQGASAECCRLLGVPEEGGSGLSAPRAQPTFRCAVRAPSYVCDRAWWVAADYVRSRLRPVADSAVVNGMLQFDVEQLNLLLEDEGVAVSHMEDVLALVAYEIHEWRGVLRLPARARGEGSCAIPVPILMQFLWHMSSPRSGRRPVESLETQVRDGRGAFALPQAVVREVVGEAHTVDARQWMALLARFMVQTPGSCAAHMAVDPRHQARGPGGECNVSAQMLRVALECALSLVSKAAARPDMYSAQAEINTYAAVACPSSLEPNVFASAVAHAQAELGRAERSTMAELGRPCSSPQGADITYAAADAITCIARAQGACADDCALRQTASVSAAAAQVDFRAVTSLVPGTTDPAYTLGMVSDEHSDCSHYVAYAVRSSLPQVLLLAHDHSATNMVRSAVGGWLQRLLALGADGSSAWRLMLSVHRIALEAWSGLAHTDALRRIRNPPVVDDEPLDVPCLLDSVRGWDQAAYERIVAPLVRAAETAPEEAARYRFAERFSAMCAHSACAYVDGTRAALLSDTAVSTLAVLLVSAVALDVMARESGAARLSQFALTRAEYDGTVVIPPILASGPELATAIFSVPSARWADVCDALCSMFIGSTHAFAFVMGGSNTGLPWLRTAAASVQATLFSATTRSISDSGVITRTLSPVLELVYHRADATRRAPPYARREDDLRLCEDAWRVVRDKYLRS